MGKPLLLLEAASAYRGDLEDRLTELLCTALSEHPGFLRALLASMGVSVEYQGADVVTQQSFPDGPARVDVVISTYGETHRRRAVVFIENKFNPRKRVGAYWFTEDQARRQATALAGQDADERRLVAIASDCDLGRRLSVPTEYGQPFSWRDIAEIANRAGGSSRWQDQARQPTASIAQRVLLEFWTYLKGDTMGALDESDLQALGQIMQAEERVTALLERIAEHLAWTDEVGDDWVTEGGSWVQYIGAEPEPDCWLSARQGSLYVLIAGAEWHDQAPLGQPYIYVGCGFAAKREERAAVAQSNWAEKTRTAGLEHVSDVDGVYALAGRQLADFVEQGDTLSAQARLAAEWAHTIISLASNLPEPPNLAEQRNSRPRGHVSRRARS